MRIELVIHAAAAARIHTNTLWLNCFTDVYTWTCPAGCCSPDINLLGLVGTYDQGLQFIWDPQSHRVSQQCSSSSSMLLLLQAMWITHQMMSWGLAQAATAHLAQTA
jgi:hypothetical protein